MLSEEEITKLKNSFHELSELGIDKIVNKLFNIATNNAIETIDVNIDVGDLVVVRDDAYALMRIFEDESPVIKEVADEKAIGTVVEKLSETEYKGLGSFEIRFLGDRVCFLPPICLLKIGNNVQLRKILQYLNTKIENLLDEKKEEGIQAQIDLIEKLLKIRSKSISLFYEDGEAQ